VAKGEQNKKKQKRREKKKKRSGQRWSILWFSEQLDFFYLFVMIGKIMHQTIAGRVQRPYFGGVVIGTGR